MNLITFSLMALLTVSCSKNSHHLGALKIDPPQGSVLEHQKLDNEVPFYSVRWQKPQAQGGLFMISKWPTRMSASNIPSTVQTIIEGTVSSLRSRKPVGFPEDGDIEYREVQGAFLSGHLGFIEYIDEAGNEKVVSVHMLTEGRVIWNGQFTGAKARFEQSLDMMQSIEPQG